MTDLVTRWPLEGGYTAEVFPTAGVTGEDIRDLWTREGVLDADEAERRVSEVRLVVLDRDRQPVGVCTTYLAHNEQLRAELWHLRFFTAAAHRHRHITYNLARIVSEHMIERYVSGDDRRGIGLLYQIESELLKRTVRDGVSRYSKFVFIGEDAQGRHIRVRFFPGALAPEPE
jgi:hypothetical protein